MPLSFADIRKKYIQFFEKRGHKTIPSFSLIPEKDITTLFTGSGMQPLLPYLLGEKHPLGNRLVDSQKCFRSDDIDEVGDNRHLTFFEMLGNWSLGDYFKEEQLPWFFEFLTDEARLDPEKLYVTVFAGDDKNGIPRDEESVAIWKKLFSGKRIEAKDVELLTEERGGELGMQGGRIFYYGSKKNWWSRAGTPDKMPAREPGGPDSEVFYDFYPELGGKCLKPGFGKFCHPNCDCGRFMEIGNSVFMEYVKKEGGGFEKLKQRNVDFGGGLERIAAACNNNADAFLIDVFNNARSTLEAGTGKKYEENIRLFRIILDHIRSAVFLIADGITPSNTDRGYLLRRLIRRSVWFGDQLGAKQSAVSGRSTISLVAKNFVEEYMAEYPQGHGLSAHADKIFEEIEKEEKNFRATLARGAKELARFMAKGEISGEDAFQLFTTYGLPFELTIEEAQKNGIKLTDIEGFKERLKKHQEISRAGAEKKFGGHGLILNGELKAANEEELKKVTRLHTATHMMQQALREVLGPEVKQMGSDITVERTRFDFAFSRKLTPEEIKAVEDKVNAKIKEDLPMQKVVLPKAEAEKSGALYFFKEKYPDPVNVYFIGSDLKSAWSKEFCGGPHVTHTAEIGVFKIAKEEAVGSGVRRIRGVVNP